MSDLLAMLAAGALGAGSGALQSRIRDRRDERRREQELEMLRAQLDIRDEFAQRGAERAFDMEGRRYQRGLGWQDDARERKADAFDSLLSSLSAQPTAQASPQMGAGTAMSLMQDAPIRMDEEPIPVAQAPQMPALPAQPPDQPAPEAPLSPPAPDATGPKEGMIDKLKREELASQNATAWRKAMRERSMTTGLRPRERATRPTRIRANEDLAKTLLPTDEQWTPAMIRQARGVVTEAQKAARDEIEGEVKGGWFKLDETQRQQLVNERVQAQRAGAEEAAQTIEDDTGTPVLERPGMNGELTAQEPMADTPDGMATQIEQGATLGAQDDAMAEARLQEIQQSQPPDATREQAAEHVRTQVPTLPPRQQRDVAFKIASDAFRNGMFATPMEALTTTAGMLGVQLTPPQPMSLEDRLKVQAADLAERKYDLDRIKTVAELDKIRKKGGNLDTFMRDEMRKARPEGGLSAEDQLFIVTHEADALSQKAFDAQPESTRRMMASWFLSGMFDMKSSWWELLPFAGQDYENMPLNVFKYDSVKDRFYVSEGPLNQRGSTELTKRKLRGNNPKLARLVEQLVADGTIETTRGGS